MFASKIKMRMKKVALYLELILAIFIAVGIIVGMVDLFRYLMLILKTNAIDTYDLFQRFLGHVLLLVVGVELIAMLIMHTTGSVIEVLLYAVARNMLISGKGMTDFILGVASIAAIFAIRKYLFVGNISENIDSLSVFSAAATLEEINETVGVNIPDNLGNTVGGVVSFLSQQTCRLIHEGAEFKVADAMIKVLKMKDGLIEKVSVTEFDDD